MGWKALGRYIGGLALAGFLLWWVFRGTDPSSLWAQFRQASWGGLLLAAALNLGHNVFRVWRWRALLQPIRADIPFRPMFSAVIVGYMTTWVVPGRLGELVRPLILSGQEGVPLGPTLGSVVADRLLDASTVVVLFAIGTWTIPMEGEVAAYAATLRTTAVVLGVLVLIFLGLMLLVDARRKYVSGWIERFPGPMRWLGNSFVSLSGGVGALRSPRLLAQIVLNSAAAWLVIALATWIGVRSAGATVSFGAILFIMPMLVLGVAVPTPGGAGSYHGMMKIGLMLFGASEVAAVSAGLLMHAMITVPVILLGLILLWTEGISWRHVIDGARQVRTLGANAADLPAPAAGGRA
jgi:uncharacterized protein (TIRG00374 family)